MAKESYFPFRSVAGDRRYSAEDWAAYFAQFLSDGVFYNKSSSLMVGAKDAMKVAVKPGSGFVAGRMYMLSTDMTLTLDIADGVLDRIDRIVLRCDYTERKISIEVKKGNYGDSPIAPELTRDTEVYELALADIYVAAGTVAISTANITDLRLNTELCGIVTGLIEQVDTTEIFNQFQLYLDEIKQMSQSEIDNLVNRVSEKLGEEFKGLYGLGESKIYKSAYSLSNGDTESTYTLDQNLNFVWDTYRASSGYSAMCINIGTYADVKSKIVGLFVYNNADYRGLKYILATAPSSAEVPGDYPAAEENIVAEVELPQEIASEKKLFNIDMSQYTDFADTDSVWLILCDDSDYRIDSSNRISFTLFNNTEDITGTKYLAYYAVGSYNSENAEKANTAGKAGYAKKAGAKSLTEFNIITATDDETVRTVTVEGDAIKFVTKGYSQEVDTLQTISATAYINITDLIGKGVQLILQASDNGTKLNTAALATVPAVVGITNYIKYGEDFEELILDLDGLEVDTETSGMVWLLVGYEHNIAPVDGVVTIEGNTVTLKAHYTDPEAFVVADHVKGDAKLTTEAIKNTLGYTPVSTETVDKLQEEISNQSETIKAQVINELVTGKELSDSDNHFNIATIKSGYEISTTGYVAEANSLSSDLIPVEYGQTVYINNLPTYTSDEGIKRRFGLFDADGNFISLGHNGDQTSSQYSYTVGTLSDEENVAYFAFCIYQRVTDESVRNSLDYSQIMVTFDEFRDYSEYEEPTGTDINIDTSKPTKDKKMLIFGDSITETATMDDDGSNYVEGKRVNWMTYASEMLETTNFKNYACSGAMYKDYTDATDYRQWVSNQIALAMADTSNDDVDIIVLSLGTNDGSSNDDFESAMAVETVGELDRTKLYQAIRYAMWILKTKYPNAKCFVATPIQRAAREQDVSLRTAIIAMANRYEFMVIDAEFESGILRENEVQSGEGVDLYDGLHPNENGAKKMAELYSSVILQSYLHMSSSFLSNDSSAIPTKTSQLENDSGYLTEDDLTGLSQIETPKIVSSVDEMTDTTKHYVLDGYIYHNKEVVTEGETIITYPNQLDPSTATLNARLSGSSASVTQSSSYNGYFVSDFIEISNYHEITPYTVRLNWELQEIGDNKVVFFDSNKTRIGHTYIDPDSNCSVSDGKTVIDTKTIYISGGSEAPSDESAVKYVRFQLGVNVGTALQTSDIENCEVTFDAIYETETTETTTTQEWVNSGISYTPTFKTDLVGVLGEDNVIYLSDNLPSGTYTLKYPDDDYATIGAISK